MPTLNDKTKDALKGLLNNLNLGLAKADFGAVVVSLIEGKPVTLDDTQKANLAQLVNNLNLGTAHANLGDLLIALLDNATAHTAASALTGNEREKIRQLCNNLNLGLRAVDFGGHVDGVIATAASASGSTGSGSTGGTSGGTTGSAASGGATPPTAKNPSITTQPVAPAAFTEGGKLELTVVASDAVSFQWQHDGTNIPGATSATYTKAAATPADSGKYKVIVTGATGTTPVTSNEVTVTVTAAVKNPKITTQPAAPAALTEGDKLELKVVASDAVSFQWQHDGTNIPGATSATYTKASATPADSGKYKVVVTGASGSTAVTSNEVTVTVNAKPVTLNGFKLSGGTGANAVSADTDPDTFKVTVKADGSDPVTVTVAVDPANAPWGTVTAPAIDDAGKAFVDEAALAWNATAHTFVVKGKAEGDAVITLTNTAKTVKLKVTVAAP